MGIANAFSKAEENLGNTIDSIGSVIHNEIYDMTQEKNDEYYRKLLEKKVEEMNKERKEARKEIKKNEPIVINPNSNEPNSYVGATYDNEIAERKRKEMKLTIEKAELKREVEQIMPSSGAGLPAAAKTINLSAGEAEPQILHRIPNIIEEQQSISETQFE